MTRTLEVLEPTAAAACCAPLAEPSLTGPEVEATARLFKALGDPARVRIVNLLANSAGPVCGCDMEGPLGLSQPTVSFHLKKLFEAGLLLREKRGVWVYWSVNPVAAARLGEVMRFDPAPTGDRKKKEES